MEQLHQYIAAARQAGHDDGQIRDSLVTAGWDASRVNTALGNPAQPSPPPKHSDHAKPRSRKAIGLVSAAALVVLAAGGIVADRFHPTHVAPGPPRPAPSLTLYYDDGKTVLWQDNNPAVEPAAQPTNAPYFVDVVRAELQQKYGDSYWKQGAWQITTSLNTGLQATAEKLVTDNYANIQTRTGGAADEEATILQDVQTGQIKALVGGTDRSNPDHGQINFAITPLEPGSSVHPFAYADLLEHTTNTGAGTAMDDAPAPFPGYPCTIVSGSGNNCFRDYDLLYPGNISMRYALGGQRNVPAMQAIYAAAGSNDAATAVNQFAGLIRTMGASSGYNCYSDWALTKTAQCYGTAVLGDAAYLSLADEVHALSTFANNGRVVPQTAIVSVRLNGRIVSAWHNPVGQQTIRPDTAYIINDILSDPNASYLPGSCTAGSCTSLSSFGYKFQRYSGWHFAVDTGTTTNNFSAVMASWSGKYAVASWVGNHGQAQSLSSARNASGETLTEPLTRGLMEAAHHNLAPRNWQRPAGIQTLPAFVTTTHIHYGDVEPSPSEDIYPAWYKP